MTTLRREPSLADSLVLSQIGMMALLDRLESQAIEVQRRGDRCRQLERRLEASGRDHLAFERLSDRRNEEYHRALADHRDLLKKRGVKARDLPALPSTWEADAKRIVSEEIPF